MVTNLETIHGIIRTITSLFSESTVTHKDSIQLQLYLKLNVAFYNKH